MLNISEGCEPVNRLYIAPAAPVTTIIPFVKVNKRIELSDLSDLREVVRIYEPS